jgi:hypothetical protein
MPARASIDKNLTGICEINAAGSQLALESAAKNVRHSAR